MPVTTESFAEIYSGNLQGIMSEEQYINMAKSLTGIWFAVSFFENPHESRKMSGEEAGLVLLGLYEEVKGRKSLSGTFPYTYVRDRANPVFIKVYDPKKCGGSCSTISPEPWWIFSMIEPLPEELRKIKDKKN